MARRAVFEYDRPVSTENSLLELVARAPLSTRVHRLRFRAASAFRWAAGQYLIVMRAGGHELALPYSIASACDPEHPGELEIAAAFGAGADVIDALVPGDRIEVQGPAGEFTWQAEPRAAALLIGVGTGIAPLRALIQEELRRPRATRLLLLAGHRAPEDVLFADDFAELARREPRFTFLPTLTGAHEHWIGRRGRVQAQLAEAVASLGELDAYLCGRLDMVSEVTIALELLGVPRARIRSEGY